MNNVSLTARIREKTGKEAAKHLRRSGWVPAVLYGGEKDPVPVQVEAHQLETILRQAHLTSVISLRVEGGERCQVLLRDPVRHPLTDELLHVDLMRVSRASRVRVEVPVELVGAAKGVLAGGVLDQVLHTMEIECRASDIPESIKVDVSDLEIGDHIEVGALQFPDIRILTDPSATIVTISAPRVVEEEVEEEEAVEEEAAEPEVVGRKKAEEEAESEES